MTGDFMLRKLCLREIRSSLGRFFAIAAIIALGVGLFAGLRVSKRAMVETGEEYLQDLQFFDFRLLSTLGFTDEDVEAIGALSNVSAAEGSVFQDVLYVTQNGTDSVAAMHTLPSQVNLPDLRAGRWPERPDECVLDATNIPASMIGSKLTLSADNDEDTLEMFAYEEYTIVGLVDSPIYINFERGSTSLGSGTVSCFGYLLPEGFDTDYYTEIYLTLTETAPIYSEEYDAIADANEPLLEDALAERAEIRYETLLQDGQEAIDDAREELEQAKIDYADGKEEAEQELADGWQELVDARAELDDGWQELADGEQELTDQIAEANAEIADGERELSDALLELQDGEQEYADSGKGLEDGEKEMADALAELEDAEQEYRDGYQEYLSGLAEFEDGKIRYEQGLTDYEDGLRQYEDGMASYASGKAQYADGLAQYEVGYTQYQEARAAFDALVPDIGVIREQVEANQATVEAMRPLFNQLLDGILAALGDPSLDSHEALIAALRADDGGPLTMQVDAILAMLAGQYPGAPATTAELLDGWEQMEQYDLAVQTLENYEALEENRIFLENTKSQLDAAAKQLSSARAQLTDAWLQLEDAKQELEDTEVQLADGWAELEDGRQELEDGRAELDDGWAEYYDGRAELDDGWQQYRDARQELDDGWAEYHDGVQELSDARQTLANETADAQAELADARQELEDGEQEYTDGLADYYDGKAEAEEELADAAEKIADGEQELADAEQELADLEPADTYVLGRDTNIGYVCFESDTDIVSAVASVFPLFFFLVAALVCITTMTRMVDDERTKIGVLKALGYSSGAIMGKYLAYAGTASLLGCAIGFLGGSWLFPVVMWKVYDIMYSFSYPIRYVLDWQLAAFSIGLYLLCALGSTWLVCRSSLREVAAELIRPKAPKAGKRILLERIPFLWKRMKFLYKVSARNIFRYKKRFFMMILGIGGCTALLLTGFGIRDSIADVVDFQYQEISKYDISVSFLDPLTQEEQSQFLEDTGQWVQDAVFFHSSTVDVTSGSVTKSVNLIVSDAEMTGFTDFHLNGTSVPYPGNGEVLLNNGLAEVLHVEIGDTITVRDGDMRTAELTVSGIYENYIYNYLFITPETAEAQFGQTMDVKTAYVRTQSEIDVRAAGAAIADMDEVSSITVNADMQDRVGAMLNSLNYIVLLVIICAGSLAFIVLYNLTNINITERIREIATIKVLGFYAGETSAYVFRENTVLTAIGALVGILLGRMLHAYVMSKIQIDMMHFDVRIMWSSYLIAFGLTLVFAAIVNFVMFFKLEKINMAESLKSIE